MPELIPVLDEKQIRKRVKEVAEEISSDYKDKELVLVGVLKGAFIFLADLVRFLTIPVQMDFITISSYGNNITSSESISFTKGLTIDVNKKNVIVVEDIIDTGLTLKFLEDHLRSQGAESVKICTMVDKRERRKTNVRIDYACHIVDNGFLVGYGLDYAEAYRELPGIYHLKL